MRHSAGQASAPAEESSPNESPFVAPTRRGVFAVAGAWPSVTARAAQEESFAGDDKPALSLGSRNAERPPPRALFLLFSECPALRTHARADVRPNAPENSENASNVDGGVKDGARRAVGRSRALRGRAAAFVSASCCNAAVPEADAKTGKTIFGRRAASLVSEATLRPYPIFFLSFFSSRLCSLFVVPLARLTQLFISSRALPRRVRSGFVSFSFSLGILPRRRARCARRCCRGQVMHHFW